MLGSYPGARPHFDGMWICCATVTLFIWHNRSILTVSVSAVLVVDCWMHCSVYSSGINGQTYRNTVDLVKCISVHPGARCLPCLYTTLDRHSVVCLFTSLPLCQRFSKPVELISSNSTHVIEHSQIVPPH